MRHDLGVLDNGRDAALTQLLQKKCETCSARNVYNMAYNAGSIPSYDADTGTSGASSPEYMAFPAVTPVSSSQPLGWRGIKVQRFKVSSGVFEIPPVQAHRFTLQLSGASLIEAHWGDRDCRRNDINWLGSGQVIAVPSGLPVSWNFKGIGDELVVDIDPALLAEVAQQFFAGDVKQVAVVPTLGLPDPVFDRLGRLLLSEVEGQGPGNRVFAESLALAVAIHAVRRFSTLALGELPAPKNVAGGRLRRVVEYMNANLGEDLSLSQLAALTGLSAPHFARAFRLATGEPPHRYLVRLRIERAQELLERATLPIIEVGLCCGFQSPSYFATTFKKLTGMSPRAWRVARR